jgi:hypothetical protein
MEESDIGRNMENPWRFDACIFLADGANEHELAGGQRGTGPALWKPLSILFSKEIHGHGSHCAAPVIDNSSNSRA